MGRRELDRAEWFPGARLSFAEHVFRGKPEDRVAIVHASELRPLAELTWGELRTATAEVAAGLRALGVGPGDRVAGYLPNVVEAAVAFLACASIGATWSSCSPDFGARSVIDRLAQIEPKVLLAVDGYRYGGRDFDRLDVVAEIREAIPSLEQTVLLPYLDPAGAGRFPRSLPWDRLRSRGAGAGLEFAQLPFDHPLWVLYSSGTTGLPKGIVHGQGGILLEYLKELHLHVDAQPGERIFWFTTTGWMMWNYLLGALLTDAAIVLYDGNPAAPAPDVLWDLAASAGITCFGTSAAYLAACRKNDVEPTRGRDLGALRSIGSTGSPLAPEGFRWVYRHVGAETWLFSMSGGTDLATAFVGGVPTLPVYAGELQARQLGAAVEAFDEDGRPIDRRGRRARPHAADALDAAPPLGRRRPLAPARQLLLRLPGRLAPRRLDRDHLPRHGGHLRPLGLDDQPRRGAHRDERALPRGAGARAGGRRARRRPAARGDGRLDHPLRRRPRGRRPRRAARRRAPRPDPATTAHRATSPTRSARSPPSRGRSRGRWSRCP